MMQVPCNDSGPTDSQGMQRMEEMSWDMHANDSSWLELSVVGVLKSFLDVSCVLKDHGRWQLHLNLGCHGWSSEDLVPVSNSKILQWLGLDKMELHGVSNFESKNRKVSQGGGVESTKAIVTATRKAVTFQNSSRGLTIDRVVESPKVTRIEEGIIDAGGKVIQDSREPTGYK
ncbi:hypothetical protein QYF36_006365 [Acer negundo]|nr:hypothetical protein QYF36_006365 [Acer negundo]